MKLLFFMVPSFWPNNKQLFSQENILEENILYILRKERRAWICKIELESAKGEVIEQSDFLLQFGTYALKIRI